MRGLCAVVTILKTRGHFLIAVAHILFLLASSVVSLQIRTNASDPRTCDFLMVSNLVSVLDCQTLKGACVVKMLTNTYSSTFFI